jgi:hypothetical protein
MNFSRRNDSAPFAAGTGHDTYGGFINEFHKLNLTAKGAEERKGKNDLKPFTESESFYRFLCALCDFACK